MGYRGCESHGFISLGLYTCCSLCQQFPQPRSCALTGISPRLPPLGASPHIPSCVGAPVLPRFALFASIQESILASLQAHGFWAPLLGLRGCLGVGLGATPLLAAEVEAPVGVCWREESLL